MAITTLHLLTSVAVSGGGAEPSVDQSRCGLEGQELPRRGVYVSYAPVWARSLGGNRRGEGWPRLRWRSAGAPPLSKRRLRRWNCRLVRCRAVAPWRFVNAPRERGFDQAGPGQLLPAHRESLHEDMTLSRSSYPMTFSRSTGSWPRAT